MKKIFGKPEKMDMKKVHDLANAIGKSMPELPTISIGRTPDRIVISIRSEDESYPWISLHMDDGSIADLIEVLGFYIRHKYTVSVYELDEDEQIT